eukprot:6194949-Pleurochrysis_carterae.AAC.2
MACAQARTAEKPLKRLKGRQLAFLASKVPVLQKVMEFKHIWRSYFEQASRMRMTGYLDTTSDTAKQLDRDAV